MVLVNIFYGMTIISFVVAMMFCTAWLIAELINHPIRRFCFAMTEDSSITCFIFLALTVVGLLFI